MNTIFDPPAYPLDAFYKMVRDALYEVGRFMQAPEALVANAFIGTMSVACQRHVDVKLPMGLVRPVSVNVATIAESGERKTAVDNLVCAPIYAHDAQAVRDHVSKVAKYRADLHCWDIVNAAIQQKVRKAVMNGKDLETHCDELAAHAHDMPMQPVSEQVIYQKLNEPTLMDVLRGNGRAIAIMSDEGEIVLRGGAMSKMGVLNKVWDGTSELVLDRMDDHVQVSNPRVTVNFMVQTRVFAKFMQKNGDVARASGHLARYLVAYPTSTQGTRQATLEEPVWKHLPAFHDRVAELLAASGDAEPQILSFSPEAKEEWVRVQNQVECRLGTSGDLANVRDFASKFMEISSRIAAILHHFTAQEGSIISLETLQRALSLSSWYLDEFRRLFGDTNDEPQVITDARKVLRYLHGHVWRRNLDHIPRNDVRQCGPVRQRGRFEAALDQLCHDGSIAVGPLQGKRKLYVFLNHWAFQQLALN